MRSKKYHATGTWWRSSCVDALLYTPQRRVKIIGFMWCKEKHDKVFSLQFAYKIGGPDCQGHDYEWFTTEEIPPDSAETYPEIED